MSRLDIIMGVTYKLKEDVVRFIISQRQGNPLASCRQLAESASQKFGLRLSKSSVHDVLKESGIITPRGRKPKGKFEIPQEKRIQIQAGLSQVKLLPDPVEVKAQAQEVPKNEIETSPEYDGAGRIFQKAVLWDLGVYSQENIKEADWSYYLTYCKGVRVLLENGQSFFIDLPLPLERCIKETADGLINNVKPLIINKVSDENLLKSCMEAQNGFKINQISIVDYKDHNILDFSSIMEYKRSFIIKNRIFVENYENNLLERSKVIFFSQILNNTNVIDNIMNLKGLDKTSEDQKLVTLLINDGYENKGILQTAVDKLNAMYLRDELGRLVEVKFLSGQG